MKNLKTRESGKRSNIFHNIRVAQGNCKMKCNCKIYACTDTHTKIDLK